MNIDEITMTTLPKTTTYRYFKEVSWEKYTKLPIKFRNFDVVVRNFIGSKLFTILDPANSKKIKTSETPGINYEITYKNVVGGVELSKVRAPKGLGTAWEASYLGLNPNYQGQGIAKDFYLWLLKNAKYTNVGMIRAGDSQTTGSKKLWQALAKHTLMFAYNPSN
jgi:hypothetical protein